MFTTNQEIMDFALSIRYSWPEKEFIEEHYDALSKKNSKLSGKSKMSTICSEMLPYIINWHFEEFSSKNKHSALEDGIAKELEEKGILIKSDDSLRDEKNNSIIIPRVRIKEHKKGNEKIPFMDIPILLFFKDVPVIVSPQYSKSSRIWTEQNRLRFRIASNYIKENWQKEPGLILVLNKSSFEVNGGKNINDYTKMQGKIKQLYEGFGVIVTYFKKERKEFYDYCEYNIEKSTKKLLLELKEKNIDLRDF